MLWRGAILPALVTALLLLPLLRRRWFAVVSPIALGLGYLAGHVAIIGWPQRWPPVEGRDLMPYVVLVGALIGVVTGLAGPAKWPLRVIGAAVLPWLLLRSYVRYTWSAGESAMHLLGLTVVLTAVWTLLDRVAASQRGAVVPLGLALTATATAIAVGVSGTALFAQLAGALAAGLGVLVLVAWHDRQSSSRPIVPLAALALATIWITGHFYAELDAWAAVLLVVAPCLLGLHRRFDARRPRRAVLLTLLCLLVPLAGAVGLAVRQHLPAALGR